MILIDYMTQSTEPDFELIIEDYIKNTITIKAHREFLSSKSDFFKKLLYGNFRESETDTVILKANNIDIASDVILFLYGQDPNKDKLLDWKYLLEFITFKNYICIPIEEKLWSSINILPEHFDMLLDVVDMVGCDEITIKCINRNLPHDYNLNKFTKEMVNIMYMHAKQEQMAIHSLRFMEVWNFDEYQLQDFVTESPRSQNGEITDLDENIPINVCFSLDNKKLVTIVVSNYTNYIKIWDVNNGENIQRFNINVKTNVKAYMKNIQNIPVQGYYYFPLCFYSENVIMFGNYFNKNVIMFDLLTGDMTKICKCKCYTIKKTSKIELYTMAFSQNKQLIARNGKGRIKIWSINKNAPLHTLDDTISNKRDHYKCSDPDILCHSYYRRQSSLCFSPDNKILASHNNENIIKIWNLTTERVTKIINFDCQHTANIINNTHFFSNEILTVVNNYGGINAINITLDQEKIKFTINKIHVADDKQYMMSTVFFSYDKIITMFNNAKGMKNIKVWDSDGKNLLTTLTVKKGELFCFAFTDVDASLVERLKNFLEV